MKAMFFGNTMLSDHVLEKNARALVTNHATSFHERDILFRCWDEALYSGEH
jgi:hypothetical protein